MGKNIFIYTNDTDISRSIEKIFRKKLIRSGLTARGSYSEDIELIICIGGDGTLLRLVQDFGFPKTPIVGINTGHLGFFQEILPEKIDDFIFLYNQGRYSIQGLNGVSCSVRTDSGTARHLALNEITVKGMLTHPIHLNISINNSFIERFSGDGICVSTPAGSTAYNYALGGSIVDPRLSLLQVTPIAPMQNIAYRSLASGILLPANDKLTVIPCNDVDRTLSVTYDGMLAEYEGVTELSMQLSRKKINLVRFDDYQFWEKVKSKFL
ncbi:MAG: NAD(+)/NADH kinase [Anaerovoracaceae bacterium]|nr:NAD(+)/NADH kinase [Anaerovoracaceae bacterium]